MSKISIIVPAYNCEKYIKKCIESILLQTFKNYELILINDGSIDKTKEICENYKKKDNRITFINQENIGVSKTREKALKIAKSEYVIFVDADDYIEKDFVEILYNNINNQEVDIVCCNSKNFGLDSRTPINIRQDKIINNKVEILEDYFLLYRYTCTLWGKIFKKSVFDNIGFPYMQYAEDTYLMLKIFDSTNAIKIIEYDGYNYRIQPESASSTMYKYLKLTDILKRDKLAYEICKKYGQNLINLSLIRYIDDLYGLVVAYFNINDFYEKSMTYDNIKIYFDYIKKHANVNKIKFFIVRLFFINKNITKTLVNLIKCLKIKGG